MLSIVATSAGYDVSKGLLEAGDQLIIRLPSVVSVNSMTMLAMVSSTVRYYYEVSLPIAEHRGLLSILHVRDM